MIVGMDHRHERRIAQGAVAIARGLPRRMIHDDDGLRIIRRGTRLPQAQMSEHHARYGSIAESHVTPRDAAMAAATQTG